MLLRFQFHPVRPYSLLDILERPDSGHCSFAQEGNACAACIATAHGRSECSKLLRFNLFRPICDKGRPWLCKRKLRQSEIVRPIDNHSPCAGLGVSKSSGLSTSFFLNAAEEKYFLAHKKLNHLLRFRIFPDQKRLDRTLAFFSL